jgi:hypothetical protein
LKINVCLDKALVEEAKELIWEYKDVFSWTHKDLEEIPSSFAQHRIELENNVPLVHQAHYRMNLHYANIIK